MNEPIPLYKQGDNVFLHTRPVIILQTYTYCRCCGRFLDAAEYSIKFITTGVVTHQVKEQDLSFTEG